MFQAGASLFFFLFIIRNLMRKKKRANILSFKTALARRVNSLLALLERF